MAKLFLVKAPVAVLLLAWCLAPLLQPSSPLRSTGPWPAAYLTALPSVQPLVCGRSGPTPGRAQPRSSGGAAASGASDAVGLLTDPRAQSTRGLGDESNGVTPAIAFAPVEPPALRRCRPLIGSHAVAKRAQRGLHTAGRDPPIS